MRRRGSAFQLQPGGGLLLPLLLALVLVVGWPQAVSASAPAAPSPAIHLDAGTRRLVDDADLGVGRAGSGADGVSDDSLRPGMEGHTRSTLRRVSTAALDGEQHAPAAGGSDSPSLAAAGDAKEAVEEVVGGVKAEYYRDVDDDEEEHDAGAAAAGAPMMMLSASLAPLHRDAAAGADEDPSYDPSFEQHVAEQKLEQSDPLLKALREASAKQQQRAAAPTTPSVAAEGQQQQPEEEEEEAYDVTVLLAATGSDPLVLLNCLRSLRDNLPRASPATASWELLVVQVGNGLGERERIFTALDVEWQQEARVRLVEERGKNLSHAFNMAASHARGTHLLFFLETMEVPARSGFTFPPPPPPGKAVDNVLDYLLSVIHQDQYATVGVVGPKVVYGGEDVVHHAGIGWLNVRFPHEHFVWGDDADARGNVPFPYFRAQGLHTLNKRVNNVREGGEEATGGAVGSRTRRAAHRTSGAEDSDDTVGGEQVRTVLERGVPLAKRRQEMEAVSVKGMFTSRRLFRSLGGFHAAKFGDQYFDVDYCLRVGGLLPPSPSAPSPSPPPLLLLSARAAAAPSPGASHAASWPVSSSAQHLRVIYDPHAVFYHYDPHPYHEEALSPQSRDAIAFADKWEAHPTLRALVDRSKNGGLANTTVIWNMECGLGQVLGFTVEGINFVLGLNELVYVMAEPTAFDACYKDLQKAGLAASTLAVFRAANQRRADAPQEAGNTIYLVLHRDPGRYSSHLYDLRGVEPDYIIGRSMFETDTIPFPWIGSSAKVDEIWVPSDFNIRTFAGAGIPARKLHQIGEALDASVFDPEAVRQPLPLASRAKFNFMTNGKWEQRKGWDVLLRAYYAEFAAKGATTDVALHFVARMNDEAREQFRAFQHNISRELGVPVGELPRVEFATEIVPFALMPALYKAADAFVLATHGEGWGLPLMEAMAMQIPTIATNWSGSTQFMKEGNSFGVEVESLVPASTREHQWAQPSHAHLRRLMRLVYTAHVEPTSPERSQVAAVVAQARRDVLAHWGLDEVARSVVDRLSEIKSSGKLAEAKRARTPASRYSAYSYSSSASASSAASSTAETLGRKKIKIVNDL